MSEVEIRVDHSDDAMCITVYRPSRHEPFILAETSQGIEPVHKQYYERRYRRAESTWSSS